MNIKELITNEPFNYEWVDKRNDPFYEKHKIIGVRYFNCDSCVEKYFSPSYPENGKLMISSWPEQNHNNYIITYSYPIFFSGKMSYMFTDEIITNPTRVLEQPVFSFGGHYEFCDKNGNLYNDDSIFLLYKWEYEIFNYYQKLTDDKIIKIIKTIEYYMTDIMPKIFRKTEYDELHGRFQNIITQLKFKYQKDFKPSFKDFAHLI